MELNKRLEKLIKALKMNQKGLFLLKHGTILKKLNQNEVDLAMLKEVEENSDCHEFISQEEAMKELGL